MKVPKSVLKGCTSLEFYLIQHRLYMEAFHMRGYRGILPKENSYTRSIEKQLIRRYLKRIIRFLPWAPTMRLIIEHIRDSEKHDEEWFSFDSWLMENNIDYYQTEKYVSPFSGMNIETVRAVCPHTFEGVWDSKQEVRHGRAIALEYWRFPDGSAFRFEDGEGYARYLGLSL